MRPAKSSQDLDASQRRRQIATILAKAIQPLRELVVNSLHPKSPNPANCALAISPESSLSVSVPAGEERESNGDR